ncbi:MAG: hypothetical protein IT583_04750 [Verrucomicrobia bacterium]|nr:hypothetical protein [Verrucomicrobiota bacterium]
MKIYQGELTPAEIYKETTSIVRKSALNLDGILDEAIWAGATRFEPFVPAKGFTGASTATMTNNAFMFMLISSLTGGEPMAQTAGLVTYDNEFIYAAFICDEPDMASLKKDVTENSIAVYSDDCIGLMLDSDNNRNDYYHLLCNPLGKYGAAFRSQSGQIGSAVPVFKCLTGTNIRTNGWTVEMAIPFSSITLDTVKNPIAVNLARTRRSSLRKIEESSISEKGAFHEPALFRPAELVGADISPYAIEIKYPSVGGISSTSNSLKAGITTSVKNTGQQIRYLSVTVGEDAAGNISTFDFIIIPDEEKELSVELPIKTNGVFNITYLIKEDGKIIFDSTYAVQIDDIRFSPLSVEITKPSYRNAFFATQTADEITGILSLQMTLGEYTGSTADILLLNTAGETTASAGVSIISSNQLFSLPLPVDMAVGDYTLTVKITKNGLQLAEQTAPISKLPEALGTEVRLARTADGTVMSRNGTPYFPIWWWGGSPYAEIATNGGGDGLVVQVTSAASVTNLDTLHALNQHAIVTLYSGISVDALFKDQSSLSQASRDYFTNMVNLVKNHPAVLAYYLIDEPEVKAFDPRVLEEAYQLIRENDPYHPVLICNDSVDGIHTYKNAHDMFFPDPYICPQTNNTLTQPMTYISTFIDNAVSDGGGKKLVGNTPQIFNYADFGKPNNRAPTFMETRCAMYLAIIHGARGFSLYKYGDSTWAGGTNTTKKGGVNYPDLRVGTPFLISEIKTLSESLLLGQTTPAQATNSNIHLLFKKLGSDYYLFACNVTNKVVSSAITNLPAGITNLSVVSENRKVTPAAGKFTDSFKAYDVHVYTTRTNLTTSATLDEIKTAILNAGGTFY